MNFFESLRRANIDFYTAHPLEQFSDAELEQLAQQQGLTVAELKTQMTTPQVEMTCPLCGKASTHLTMCKGCGGDAWGFELRGFCISPRKGALRDGVSDRDQGMV